MATEGSRQGRMGVRN